jgi:hypothetical protein
MSFNFLYTFCLKYLSFYEELSEVLSKIYIGPRVKYPLLLSDCNKTLIFWRFPKKNIQMSNFMKILRVGAEFFNGGDERTHRQTYDETNAPKKCNFSKFVYPHCDSTKA